MKLSPAWRPLSDFVLLTPGPSTRFCVSELRIAGNAGAGQGVADEVPKPEALNLAFSLNTPAQQQVNATW
jgi:hypothetical protein